MISVQTASFIYYYGTEENRNKMINREFDAEVTFISVDEERKICVRCGYQEPAVSEMTNPTWVEIGQQRLRWFPRYGMGLCFPCHEKYPDYIQAKIGFPTTKETVEPLYDEGVWRGMYDEMGNVYDGVIRTKKQTSMRGYNDVIQTPLDKETAQEKHIQEITEKYGKYFTKEDERPKVLEIC